MSRIARLASLVLLSIVAAGSFGPQSTARRLSQSPTPPATPPANEVLEGEAPPAPEVSAPPPESVPTPTDASCPPGMVLVEGLYCPTVAFNCLRYVNDDKLRCAEYAKTRRCFGALSPKRFCIDRFEYPNREGATPLLGLTWERAKAECESASKRLCTESEWTLACEGPAPLPYPYGFIRDSRVCNIDRPYRFPNDAAYANPSTRSEEIARLNQSEPSGTRRGCVSPYGVYDMTGNVDEWVLNEKGSRSSYPFISGLKGGYWGPVRNRCRPITDVHNIWHHGYQIGLRCCADPTDVVVPQCNANDMGADAAQCTLP